jgi:hypothetical protein
MIVIYVFIDEAAGGRFMNPTQVLTREMEEAIQDCLECRRVCLRTFSHLLTLEPDAELADPRAA